MPARIGSIHVFGANALAQKPCRGALNAEVKNIGSAFDAQILARQSHKQLFLVQLIIQEMRLAQHRKNQS